MPQNGDLRVWWIPQIPMTPFYVPVRSLREGSLVLDTLALYDAFQLNHHIKPDYSNVGGLHVFDAQDDTEGPDGSWVDWCDDDDRDIFEPGDPH